MPLSEHEQRILAEIERRLLEEDPKFAHQVGHSFRAHLARRLKLAAFAFVVGLAVLVVGFVKSVFIGVVGFLLMLVAVFSFVHTLRRRATVERPVSGTPGQGQTQGQGPGQPPRAGRPGLESWWGRMTDRWRQRWEERGGQGPP
jgi:hypothetical protein